MYTADSDDQVTPALQLLIGRLRDTRPAFANVATALQSESERQFAAEEGPLGAWPALSEKSTIPRREARGTWPGKKLQETAGGLAASVQTGYGAAEAWIGSNKPYAAMQHFGGVTSPRSMIPGAVIPARPYLPFHPETNALTPQAATTVLEALGAHLEHGR